MKNVWKGMMLGALSGAGIGIALDVAEALGKRGGAISRRASATVRDASDDGVARVKEAHVPERAREFLAETLDTFHEGEAAVIDKARGVASRN